MQELNTDVCIVELDIVEFSSYKNDDERREILLSFNGLLADAGKLILPHGSFNKKYPHHGTGDGFYIMLDADTRCIVALEFVWRLKKALNDYNSNHGDLPLKLRCVLGYGRVEWMEEAKQFFGSVLTDAERLISDESFKQNQKKTEKNTVLFLTSLFHKKLYNEITKDENFYHLHKLKWTQCPVHDKHQQMHIGYQLEEYESSDEQHIKTPSYRETLIEFVRIEPLLNLRLNIEKNYFPLELTNKPDSSFIQYNNEQLNDINLKLIKADKFIIELGEASGKRFILLGPAGCGKTNFLRRLVFELASKNIPVFFVVLRELEEKDFNSDISELVKSRIQRYGLPNTELKSLKKLIKSKTGVFIFDGLDELKHHQQLSDKFQLSIRDWFLHAPCANVILTARSKTDFSVGLNIYDKLYFNGIHKKDIKAFLKSINRDQYPELDRFFAKAVADKCVWGNLPFFLILAAAAAPSGLFNEIGSTTRSATNQLTTFALIYEVLIRILKPSKGLKLEDGSSLSDKKVSHIRNQVLRQLIKQRIEDFTNKNSNWGLQSSKPIVTDFAHLRELLRKQDGLHNISERDVRILIPTGICLKEVWRGDKIEIVHNTIQEFLYAETLYKSLEEDNREPFSHEYYTSEILRFVWSCINQKKFATYTETLFKWIADINDHRLMIKKVAISILGFSDPNGKLINRLINMYNESEDIGIAGRLAEAVRRITNKDNLLLDYANKMSDGKFDPRKAEKESAFRPLTYELNDRIELSDDTVEAFYNNFTSKDAHVLKQSLIFLYRGSEKIPIHFIIKVCRLSVEVLCKTANANTSADIRCLLYALEALKRDAEGYIAELVPEWIEKLNASKKTDIVKHVEDTIYELKLKPVPLFRKLGQLKDIIMVRHGESFSNVKHLLAGKSGTNVRLTDQGRSQAEAIVKELKVYKNLSKTIFATSPKMRAIETGKIALGLKTNKILKRYENFDEADFGLWTGKSAINPDYLAWKKYPWDSQPPEGETMSAIQIRAVNGLIKVVTDYPETETIVLFSHFFPIRGLALTLGEEDINQVQNGEIVRLVRHDITKPFICNIGD
jgi:broad specificity phosphatase PhoE